MSVVDACRDVVEGRAQVYDKEAGYCLRVCRELVQKGTGISYDQFYEVIEEKVEENTGNTFWARDLQRALRNLGLQVDKSDVTPGDLAFNYKLAKQGHVAVVYSVLPDGGVTLIENTHSTRGVQLTGKNRLTRLNLWDHQGAIEIYRLPLEWTNG